MAITLTFTTPQAVAATAASAIVQVIYKRRDPWVIAVEVLDGTRLREFRVVGAVAQSLLTTLNKTNNSLAGLSEEQRILNWLQANVNPETGLTYLPAGTYSGVPD